MFARIWRWTGAGKLWDESVKQRISAELKEKAAFLIKWGCLIHFIRDYVVEATVVGGSILQFTGQHQKLRRSHQALQAFLFSGVQCVGPSMMPTFNSRGDIIIMEHLSVYNGQVDIGVLL
jgi:signal peptidase I